MTPKSNRLLVLAALTATASLVLTGCGKAPEATSEADPQAQPVDLTQSTDLFTQPVPSQIAPPEPTTVIATVNGRGITQGDLENELRILQARMRGRVPPEQMGQMMPQFQQMAMQGLVTKTLLLAEAESQNLTVTEDEIEESIAKLTETIPDNVAFEDLLAQNNTSMEELRADMALDIKVNKLIDAQVGTDEMGDEELRKYYDENPEQFEMPESAHARHILLAVAPDDDEASKASKRARAEELRTQIIGGADFAEIAKEFSEGPSNVRGGDLGTFPRGRMVPAFDEAVFGGEPGSIGELVETQFGYHIIEVLELTEARQIEFDEAKEDLATFLASQGRKDAVEAYIASLQEKADIEFPGQEQARP